MCLNLNFSRYFCPGCYPFTDRDPFLIESCPHVYFIGNQDKYDTRLLKGMFSGYLMTSNVDFLKPVMGKKVLRVPSDTLACRVRRTIG